MRNQKTILAILVISISCSIFAQTAYAIGVVATVPVGHLPFGVAYDSADHKIFVANSAGNTVSVIDDSSNTVTATIPVGSEPEGVAYDSADGKIFVANSVSGTVSVIDASTDTVTATLSSPVFSGPLGVAYDSGNGQIYVSNNSGAGTVVDIDAASNSVNIMFITVGSSPWGVAYDSADHKIFVANSVSGTVSVIDDSSNTVTATIPVSSGPRGLSYDSGTNEIFVADISSNNVSVIDGSSNTVTATIPVGSGPIEVTYDSAKNEIFVSNYNAKTVSVIDDSTHTVTATVTVGTGPDGIAFDSGTGMIYVANNLGDTVSVIDQNFVPSSSTSGGHSVVIHHPPSLGNDYYYKYPGGFTLNGKSFDITKYGITIPQQVLNLGQADNFTFKIYDERGGSTISHVGMYIHFKGDTSVANSDTSFVWDKKDGIKISDPAKSFTDVNVTRHYDGNFAYVSITFTPVKAMPDSSIIMRMWDDKLASIDLPINGAIIIVDPNAPVQVQKVPDNQYGDYATLVKLLDSDGYQMPPILHKVRGGFDLSSTVDVYWVYDKGVDKLTMVETYKDGTIIGDTVYNLIKNPSEPTLTDHNYVYIPVQNNRQNPDQEKIVMQHEEAKAAKIIQSINIPIKKLS